jgi:hypothetical protein
MNALQTKIAELVELSPHGNFQPLDVLSSLEQHDELWLSFLWVSDSQGLLLKSLSNGEYKADTLLVLCPNLQAANALSDIVLDTDGVWNANDAITIVRGPINENKWQLSGGRCILKIWWD